MRPLKLCIHIPYHRQNSNHYLQDFIREVSVCERVIFSVFISEEGLVYCNHFAHLPWYFCFQLVLQHEPPQTSSEKAFRDSKHVLSGYLEDFGRLGLLLIKMLKGYSLRFTPAYIPSKKRPSLISVMSPPPTKTKNGLVHHPQKSLPPKKMPYVLLSSSLHKQAHPSILHHILMSSSLPSSKTNMAGNRTSPFFIGYFSSSSWVHCPACYVRKLIPVRVL